MTSVYLEYLMELYTMWHYYGHYGICLFSIPLGM